MEFREYLRVIVAAFLAVSVAAHPLAFKDCGSQGSTVAGVDILPCDVLVQDTCTVTSGKNSSIGISFHSLEKADNLTVLVYGTVGPVRVPFKLPQPKACIKSNLTCPLVPDTDYVYTTALKLPSGLPEVDVVVEMDLMVGKDKYLCVQFPVVVEPSGKVGGINRFMKDIKFR